MIRLAVVCTSLLAASADTPPAAELATYRAEAAKVGRDAKSHVKLALWCEEHGLQAERLEQLALAVLADPSNAAARGLMGLVSDGGRWRRPEAVADRVKADQELAGALAEYNARREKAANTAEAQWELAVWCEKHGLKAEAIAHLTAVVRLDPKREAAWKRLGYKRRNGRMMTDAQAAAVKAEAEAQVKADRHYAAMLLRLRGQLGSKNRQAEAVQALANLTDPRAVTSVVRVFGRGEAADQARAVQLLGQIQSPTASRALSALAVNGKSAKVRDDATATLKGRDSREYLNVLILLLRDPIKYEVRPVGGPGSPGALFVQGEKFNVQRMYAPPPPPNVALMPGDRIEYDQFGLPVIVRSEGVATTTVQTLSPDEFRTQIREDERRLRAQGDNFAKSAGPLGQKVGKEVADAGIANDERLLADAERRLKLAPGSRVEVDISQSVDLVIPVGQMMVESQKAALSAQQQLQNDIKQVKSFNGAIKTANARIEQILTYLTGKSLGQDREAWSAWWTNEQGYAYSAPKAGAKPTMVEDVPLAYQPETAGPSLVVGAVSASARVVVRHSCFAAGTPVRTMEGSRPIESLRVGDVVLTEDTTTGALTFQPILTVHHNPPAPTLRIKLADDEIVATPIHRFWKAGKGWVMARELKPGDALRLIGGTTKVLSVESDRVQPVFNLEVAKGQSFFTGKTGALVHDNSLVTPTSEPFDAVKTSSTTAYQPR